MTLTSGQSLTHYEIVELLGRGGMGEVYRARDTELGRDVAIKVLPGEFALDEERLARFKREAKVLASLNHPNIAAIYGLGASESTHFLVLELVDGETLAERIARGPIPFREAIDIATKIAEALEQAHERGIVHRDLKPANIKLTPDDKLKVLDFGLAKAFAEETPPSDNSMSPTLTRDPTDKGVILGTAAYMSPEQAKGKRVDKRADIFAFGAVLYEMLTGKKAFPGEDVSEILAAVLKLEPDWSALSRSTPSSLRLLLERCLRKESKLRMRDMGDVRIALGEIESDPVPRKDGKLVRLAVAALALAAIALWAVLWPNSRAPSTGVLRFNVLRPGVLRGDYGSAVAISPDGTRVAYVTRGADAPVHGRGDIASNRRGVILLQGLGDKDASIVDGSQDGVQPFFSPDGQWLAFFADQKLKKVPVTGGPATTLCDAPVPNGGTWSEDGTIIFSPEDAVGLQRVSAEGGTPEPVTTLGPREQHCWPRVLSSRDLLFTVLGEVGRKAVALRSPSGETKVVQEGAADGRYLSSGHLLFLRDGAYYAAPFDEKRRKVTGPPVSVVEGVEPASLVVGTANLDVSANGTLVYVGGVSDVSQLVRVDREGVVTPVLETPDRYFNPRVSREGDRLALSKPSVTGAIGDIWVYDTGQETTTRFTVDPDYDITPAWSPDGSRIAFASTRDRVVFNLYEKPTDGSDEVERLTDSPSGQFLGEFSPGGHSLAFNQLNPDTGMDVYVLDLESGKSTPIRNTEFSESDPTFSPDGRFLAFMSDESGEFEIYVQPFPGSGAKLQVSTDGGWYPLFGRTGQELFYQATTSEGATRFMVVDYRVERGEFQPSRPRELFRGPYAMGPRAQYDLLPDGEHVVALRREDSGPRTVTFVLNWFQELETLAPHE